MPDTAGATQLLDEILATLSVRAHIAFRGLACGQWGINGPTQGRLAFHLVIRGRCWARVPDVSGPIELSPGAVLLYRPAGWHLLADSARTSATVMPERIEPLDRAEPGRHAGLVCGYFDGVGMCSPLVQALPAYLLWRGFDSLPEPLAPLVRTLCACAHDVSRAGETILGRLFEILLQLVLRDSSVVRMEEVEALRARADPGLRRVIESVHADPAKPWTLSTLARRAGMSRSTFAERFRTAMGVSAIAYLRRHRLALAERRMTQEGLSTREVARATGFGSASSLRRLRRRAAREGAD
jgi:AraC family transcriptional regulator, activator of mtrCDE